MLSRGGVKKAECFTAFCACALVITWLLYMQNTNRATERETTDRGGPLDLRPGPRPDSQQFRQRRLQQWCPTLTSTEQMKVYSDWRHRLTYCPVPKVGCTFWMRVFLFWINDTGADGVTSPFDISRVYTHYGEHQQLNHSWISPPAQASSNSSNPGGNATLRFMFTRDPYHRLWSAYLDKFFLPDFWRNYEATAMLKRRHNYASLKEPLCPNNLTFREFVSLLVSLNPASYNPHWRPVHRVCDPCLFRPHLLGKIETFNRDSHAVLEHARETWILDRLTGPEKTLREMNMLIDYNFWVLRGMDRKCLNSSGLSQRLWTVFQYNGYLPSTPPPRDVTAREVTPGGLKRIVRQVFTSRNTTSDDVKQQRRRVFRWAFSTVDKKDLLELPRIFHNDFVLFGYDPHPDDIFGVG